MKKLIIFISLAGMLLAPGSLNAQDLPFRKEINYIDSVLNKNPYLEKFLGITYYYSIDITPERELVVVMDFKGPFTTTYKAKLADLVHPFVTDTTEYTSQICWRCRCDDSGRETRCIFQMNTFTNSERDTIVTDDICVMLPDQPGMRIDLIRRIDELVKKALEE